MNGFRWTFAIVLVAVAAAFLWWADPYILTGLQFRPNMAETGASVVGALLVVTLIVERAMAVVNALLFGERDRQAELERIRAERGVGDAGPAETEIKAVMDAKERVRLLLGFAAGLFVSAAGVRILEGLLITSPATQVDVSALLAPVDVVLTAGLIAGGSNALAFLAQVLRDLAAPPGEPEQPANGDGGVRLEAAPEGEGPPRRAARNVRARLT